MDVGQQPTPSEVNQLIGTWKLVSAVMEDVETSERKFAWGTKPNGIIVLTSTGRWVAVQTAEGRRPPHTDEERAAAFRSMLAYSGCYRTEGGQIIIKVDIAWDESWIGTEQVRTFRIEGDKLHIEAAPQPYANFGGRVMRGILVWQRESPHRNEAN
jgi:lipocalin-like protein